MKYLELCNIVNNQWFELNKGSNNFFESKKVESKEHRILERFYSWMKTFEGLKVKYRDRMYHPSDWKSDPETEALGGKKWIPSDGAMERCFASFLQYNRDNKGAA